MKKSRLFRGLASICLAIAIVCSVAFSVGTAWAGKVDELLGTAKSGIERSLDPADYRFTSDFENGSQLIEAEIGYGTRVGAEGSVALKGLPAIDGKNVTLFGMRSGAKMQFGGTMGELVDASNVVPLADALTKEGFSVNPDMVQFYVDREANYARQKLPAATSSIRMRTRAPKSARFQSPNTTHPRSAAIRTPRSSCSAATRANPAASIRV